jgi:hypothetical protein
MRALLVVSLSSLLVACGSSASSPSSDLASDGGNDASFTQDDDGGVAPTDASEDARPEGGFTATSCASLQPDGGAATSKWAQVGDAGTLTYETLSTGETLLDFSGAGYMGGGVALPTVPAVKMVSPSGADDTNAIQAAITAVAAMPIANGVRGAVLLAAGSFQLDGSLSITASGVVLRGSGWGTGGTTLNVTGSPRMLISVNGAGSWSKQGTPILLTDTYVASGAKTIHVASTTGLAVGTNSQYTTPPGVTIAPYTFTGRIEQVGIEAMHIVAPTQTVPISDPIFGILEMSAVQNGWVRNVVADEFTTGIAIDGTAKWITIQDSTVERTAPIDGSAGYPFDYSVDGQATLIQRCTASGDNVFSYATQDRANGPNVVLDMRVKGSPINAQPHQRWATGLLLDNVDTPTGGISLMDRGWYGSGHGWAIGFGVVWNGVASEMLIQQPPGSMNWAIGSSGTRQMSAAPGSDAGILPEGTIDSPMVKVSPNSLYLEQLCERLGPAAVHAIGY